MNYFQPENANVVYKVVIMLIVMAFIVTINLHRRWHQLKAQVRREKLSLQRISLQFERQREQMRLNEQRYQEMEAEKNAIISRLQNEMQQYESGLKQASGDALEDRLHSYSIYHHFCKKLSTPSFVLTPDDWQELRQMVQHEIPRFYGAIHGGEKLVSSTEYDICLLIRLGFAPGDIVTLMDYPHGKNLSVVRKRLMQKVFSEEGSASEFDKRICKIS